MTGTSEETTTCATCGAAVPKHEWHPAAVETTADGETFIRAFCSNQCREQWADTGTDGDAAESAHPDTAAD